MYIVSELGFANAQWAAAVIETSQELIETNSRAQLPAAQELIAQCVIAMTPATQPGVGHEVIKPSQREELEEAVQDVAPPPTASQTIQPSCSAQTVYTLVQYFVFDDTRSGFD